jgi:predicted  nucleic acid-binding Zn-ribbon protein
MQTVKDESVTTSYGFFECPACGSRFYGGGQALHNRGCPESGYENCIYHVGPKCREYEQAETPANNACSGQVAGAGKSDGDSTFAATCH